MFVDPIIWRAPIALNLDPLLRNNLAELAAGQTLQIDYYTSVIRGVITGDITAEFGDPPPEPRYV